MPGAYAFDRAQGTLDVCSRRPERFACVGAAERLRASVDTEVTNPAHPDNVARCVKMVVERDCSGS